MREFLGITGLLTIIIIFIVIVEVAYHKIVNTFIVKGEKAVKTGTTDIKMDIEEFVNRTERNVKASILADEEFLAALKDKILPK